MMRTKPRPAPLSALRPQRGVALVEAMVALVIMAFGMVALAGLQNTMRRSADLAKQRGEAVRLAQQEMERARSYSVLSLPNDPPTGMQAYDDIVSVVREDAGRADSNATFGLSMRVEPWPEPTQKSIRVEVSWNDRAGEAQRVTLDSFITRADPSLSGALGIAPDASPLRRPAGRDASIPIAAKDLGNKTSVFVPGPTATVAWVFNNLTGVITGRCTVAMGTLSAALTAADVVDCSNNTFGYLLSGFVRFSFTTPPSAEQPAGPALASFDLRIDKADPLPPGSTALPAPDHQCFDNAPADRSFLQPLVSYYCIVYPNTDSTPKWSGKLLIDGIPLGSDENRICRYSADYNGDKKIANAEHPLNYRAVTGALTRQNFLVIKAGASCPAGQAVDPSAGVFSNSATVPHQPAGIETAAGG